MLMNLVQRIGQYHAKALNWVADRAKDSKIWAVVLTIFVIYELVEHLVFPWLVPLLAVKAYGG